MDAGCHQTRHLLLPPCAVHVLDCHRVPIGELVQHESVQDGVSQRWSLGDGSRITCTRCTRCTRTVEGREERGSRICLLHSLCSFSWHHPQDYTLCNVDGRTRSVAVRNAWGSAAG